MFCRVLPFALKHGIDILKVIKNKLIKEHVIIILKFKVSVL